MSGLRRALRLCLFVLLATGQAASANPPLTVESPWIREAPPGSPVLAGYLVVHNPGRKPQTIAGVQSPDFGAVEIHRSYVEDGIAKMAPVDMLEIQAGGKAVLEPEGYHLMLFRPARALQAGDTASLVLVTAAGERVTVKVPVIRQPGEDGHEHHHHH
jgi:copper(I)-binding protein